MATGVLYSMGLDLVEFVMAVEEAFEVAIPDEDAAQLTTPGKLIDYLCVRLGESTDGPPLVQTAFYRLRNAVVAELGVQRDKVRVSSALAELTDESEAAVWRRVGHRLGVSPKVLSHAPVQRWIAKLVRAPGRNLGAVAEQLAMLRPSALKDTPPTWTRTQVTEAVLRLLEHGSGVEVGRNDLQWTFVQDLGMG